jgi:hypothetical protein
MMFLVARCCLKPRGNPVAGEVCGQSLLAYKFVFSNLNSILYIFHFESAWEALGNQPETERERVGVGENV